MTIGSSAELATPPIELDPPSNRTTERPLRTTYAEPSPTASIMSSNRGGSADLRTHPIHATAPTAPHQSSIRIGRRAAKNAPTTHVRTMAAMGHGTSPTCAAPPSSASDASTSATCSHAVAQRSGPTIQVAAGQIDPSIAFG